ncbi:hypothetical protein ABIB25_000562 [Nakamurella sp. UYEF19]|uniref:hypothetical protein n=1 Tax=Nakamurella sp. UYEF19 TaxID=1756392 RepID=UPI00339875AD
MELHADEISADEIRDPGALLAEVAVDHPLREGLILLVLVENGATEMAVRHVEALSVDCREPPRDGSSKLLRAATRRMPIPDDAFPIRFQVVTVIVRPGLTVMGSSELNRILAWRHSNHLRRATTAAG